MLTRTYAVYIMTSREDGPLYVGVTNWLGKRAWQHRTGAIEGFTKRYRLHRLVYYEMFEDIEAAIAREKRLKRWRRSWKIDLIRQFNPTWRDLYEEIALG